MLEERTPAVVLHARVYGESDKIVTFITRDWGKVTGIAKGAKRSQRRFVNVLESFTHVQLRFRPSRAEDLAFIFGCDLTRSFRAPSRDLQRFALASYLVELVDAMVVGREAEQTIYELLLAGLTTLEERAVIPTVFLSAFELTLLTYTGYAPHLDGCQQCGARVPEAGDQGVNFVFSPNQGGLRCARCRGSGGPMVLISLPALQAARALQTLPLDQLYTLSVSPRGGREIRALVTSLLSRHLPRPLKSRAFLEQTGFPDDALVDGVGGE